MKTNPLRRIAAYFLGGEQNAAIRVVATWRREDDDVRAVRVETLLNGVFKRVTLYRTGPGSWSPIPV
jgi:hypothetical protein